MVLRLWVNSQFSVLRDALLQFCNFAVLLISLISLIFVTVCNFATFQLSNFPNSIREALSAVCFPP